MEAIISTPGYTVAASYYWVANFKLGEINTELKQDNRKKNLNHCNIRHRLNVKTFFFLIMQKYILKKLKHGEIVEPAFKYIIDCDHRGNKFNVH